MKTRRSGYCKCSFTSGKIWDIQKGKDQKRTRGRFMMIASELSPFLFAFTLLLPAIVRMRDVPPFVPTDWLQQNLPDPKLVTLDTRSAEEYAEGHIPGSVSSFFGSWIVERNGLLLELPAEEELMRLIGSLGIGQDSLVVVVSSADNDYSRADATRVALTLTLAGLKNVAVLDGGYAKWLREQKALSTEPGRPEATVYKGKINSNFLATKEYVMSRIGKSVILDNRDADVYFGIKTEPTAPKAGHIESALSLPTPWLYAKEGTLLPKKTLEAMVAGVIGTDKSKEVICYCGVGGYGSTSWFILTRMLGYKNVKFYDGSAQEWAMDPRAPMTAHRWS
jgi:thiosulfate/3-mercaptopyruvate sulfurtransferase